MSKYRPLILVMFLVCPFAAQAILPPDAGFRKKEILYHRQSKEAEYEKAKQKHEALVISRDQRIRKELALPPWVDNIDSSVAVKSGVINFGSHKNSSKQQSRWLFSILALLLIGAGAWWVKCATESEQNPVNGARKNKRGMTLVEILLVVTIIGLLAALIIPAVNLATRNRENARAASKLRTAVAAFTMYRSEMGSYPADVNPGIIPPEITDYFAALNITDWWTEATELGGGWDWDNGYHYKYSVSISAPTKSASQMTEFDKLIDDGNLSSGNFRQVGTQYHYIIEQ